MCRWFAYISATEPCLLEDVLVTPNHSLVNQVHEHHLPKLLAHDHTVTEEQDMKARNMLFNVDGLGVAWYTSSNADFERGNTGASSDGTQKAGLRPAMYKTIQPPGNDMVFRSIAANTETRVCFGHIRAASGTAIATVNNHPFIFGRHSFMHNGVLSDFTSVRRELSAHISDAAFANVHGSTDSEHIAALYMSILTGKGDAGSFEKEYTVQEMGRALHSAVSRIIQTQGLILGRARMRPNSLNLCATDGIKLVAMRYRNHATSQPPTLYYSTKAGVTLNRKYPGVASGAHVPGLSDTGLPETEHGKHVIVASEPSTYKDEDWELLPKNCTLGVHADGRTSIEPVEFRGGGWEAKDWGE